MKRLAVALLVGGGIAVAVAAWQLLWPIQAYREHGPFGVKASCGAAIGGVDNDEVCHDVRTERLEVWLPVLAGGGLVLVAGGAVALGARSARRALAVPAQ